MDPDPSRLNLKGIVLLIIADHAELSIGEYRLTDEVFGLDDDYLIYGRTFELTKDGAFTALILGLPGMVQ